MSETIQAKDEGPQSAIPVVCSLSSGQNVTSDIRAGMVGKFSKAMGAVSKDVLETETLDVTL